MPQTVQDDAGLFLETMTNTLMGAICISAVLALLASTWLFWAITRPLSRLRQATEAVAAGDLGARAPVKRRDEVGRVAEAFNDMADELERQEGLRQQMVADVAHELRTPLSVMRGNLEAMIDELIPASEEELDAVHHGEVMRLSRLVEDLRILSLGRCRRTTPGDSRSGRGRAWLRPPCAAWTPTAEAREHHSSPATSAATPARSWATRASYSKCWPISSPMPCATHRSAKQVTVSARAVGLDIWLAVTDQGPGVDPADLPNFFERFWKGDRSRIQFFIRFKPAAKPAVPAWAYPSSAKSSICTAAASKPRCPTKAACK